jgi:hypothetical protein
MDGPAETPDRRGGEQSVQETGTVAPGPGRRSDNPDHDPDGDEHGEVDLQLHGHRPQVLVEADVQADRGVVVALVGEVEILPVGQRGRGVLRDPGTPRPGGDHQPGGDRDEYDGEQCRIEPAQQPDDRLERRPARRIERVADLGPTKNIPPRKRKTSTPDETRPMKTWKTTTSPMARPRSPSMSRR